MNKSESIKEIATALCRFQGAVEKIKKTATNPFFHSKYANLADILDVIREPLSESGLSFVQFPKGQCELETMLMHTSGEWMSETYEMKPTKNDPQGLGSVITYQRRYALGAILGLNIDEDDDGNSASAKPKSQQTTTQPPKPVDELPIAVAEMKSAKTLDELRNCWSKWKKYQKEPTFSAMKDEVKAKLTPKPTELSPELDKLLTQSIATFESIDSIDKATTIWNSTPELQTNQLFSNAFSEAKKRLTQK